MSAIQEQEFHSEKLNISTWKKLISFTKPYKKYIAFLLTTMAISGACDVVMPYMSSIAIDNFITPGVYQGLHWYILGYLVLIALMVGCVYSFSYNAGKVEVNVCHDIRRAGFDRLQELSFSYYDVMPVGYLLSRMTNDISRLSDTIAWSLVDLMWGICFMLVALVGMFVLNWKLTLLILAVMPIVLVLSIYFRSKMLRYHREVRRTNSMITGAFNEGIMGARTTKTLVLEDLNYGEFTKLTSHMRECSIRAALVSAIYHPLIMLLGTTATAIVLWRGGISVQFMGLSLGELSFFLSLSTTFFEPVTNFARIFADFQSAQAAAERVVSLLETEPEIQDRADVIEKYGDALDPKTENWESIRGEVTFENVSFKYNKGEMVLRNFNLEVQPGETIALVGETGSGKSTIVNLICRFYEPTEGRILIDGVDYKDRSQEWLHANLGYVLQAPHLFSGTIRDNIRYGKLDATDEEVEQAARLVGVHDFIMDLEKGYDTDVGEGGGRLSTGEKQLISFARAILVDPAIFVLDEATSSIDTEAEKRIQQAIETLLEGRTSFIIAHRLSTIRSADRILVVRDGVVVEQGSHAELMALEGYYFNLYTNQFLSEREQEVLSGN